MCSHNIVRAKLEKHLSPAVLEIEDLSDGCGAKYNVTVVSELFAGKPLLQRHRLVNEALSEELKESIHALTMKTYTPDQWTNMQKAA